VSLLPLPTVCRTRWSQPIDIAMLLNLMIDKRITPQPAREKYGNGAVT
jgi:hypothetical protein